MQVLENIAIPILPPTYPIYCLPRSLNGFPLYFAQTSFTEMKRTFIKLQNEPLSKAIDQELLTVNTSI